MVIKFLIETLERLISKKGIVLIILLTEQNLNNFQTEKYFVYKTTLIKNKTKISSHIRNSERIAHFHIHSVKKLCIIRYRDILFTNILYM